MFLDVPAFVLLFHQLHLFHCSVQLLSLFGQLYLFLLDSVHCRTKEYANKHTHTSFKHGIVWAPRMYCTQDSLRFIRRSMNAHCDELLFLFFIQIILLL